MKRDLGPDEVALWIYIPLIIVFITRGSDPKNTMYNRSTMAQAQEAIRTLRQWTGGNPDREGVLGTPNRVACSHQ